MRVHFARDLGPADEAYLRGRLDSDVRLTAAAATPDPAEYDVLVAGRPSREQMAASPHLRALIVPWSGIPEQTRELMADFPTMTLHNLHHNARPVAEMTVALLLAAAKFIVPLDRALRQGDWTPRYDPPPTALLAGKTAVILGYGAIGRRVAAVCAALEMRVLAIRRGGVAARDGDATVYPAVALPDLLPRADALLICLPLTPETEGLIDEAALAALPDGAVLVNVGRGPIVDERALYEALRDGRLRAAGLDVWYNYPPDEAARGDTPPANFPFDELDNVVMSPHRAGSSDATEQLRLDALAELLNAAANGEPIPNQVDLTAGY